MLLPKPVRPVDAEKKGKDDQLLNLSIQLNLFNYYYFKYLKNIGIVIYQCSILFFKLNLNSIYIIICIYLVKINTH